VKIYLERVCHDPHKFLPMYSLVEDTQGQSEANDKLSCPQCNTKWGRCAVKAGKKTFRCIGGKLTLSS
jgi:hypothetical protein